MNPNQANEPKVMAEQQQEKITRWTVVDLPAGDGEVTIYLSIFLSIQSSISKKRFISISLYANC